jgi:uncharacterized protein YkwD
MRKPQFGAAALFAGLLLGRCGGAPGTSPTTPSGFRRLGPDRDEIAYTEPAATAKRRLFRRINADREAHGLSRLRYDLLAAKVGDAFCADAVRGRTIGHWDLAGRPPYLRWALAGGVDYQGENAASVTRTGWVVREEEIATLLLESHERMVSEKPPEDGHRRAILDPKWTHVGIGVSWEGGEFRMTEEFVRRAAEWVEIPSGPVPAGSAAAIRVQLPDGWAVGTIEVAHEPEPDSLTREEVNRRGAYGLPAPVRRLLPILKGGLHYTGGGVGDFEASGGRIEARIPLERGPGSYYVILFAEPGPVPPGNLYAPVLAVRIAAP